MGRAGGQGLGEVLRACPLTVMHCGLLLGVISGLVAALPPQAFAQGPDAGTMTVDEVVARALADNPDLRAVRAEVDAAVGRMKQAGLRPNPMLELGGQKAISPDSNLSIGVTLPLDLNGRVDGRVGVAQRELEMRRAHVAERERRLTADVRLKGGELLAARRNLEVTDELLRINREASVWWATACGKGRRRRSRRTFSSSR